METYQDQLDFITQFEREFDVLIEQTRERIALYARFMGGRVYHNGLKYARRKSLPRGRSKCLAANGSKPIYRGEPWI